MSKLICLFLISATLFLLALNSAYSEERHKHHEDVVNTTIIYNEYINNEYIEQAARESIDEGAAALSNALSGFDCTFTTQRWQVGGSVGFYGDTKRLAVGGCKKINKVLLKFTGGKDDKEWGGNVTIMLPLN